MLVSTEGISGVGKTYLIKQLADTLRRADASTAPVILEEFSKRAHDGHDLGRDILRALIEASGHDHFLQGGYPASETMLLLAIKTYDYESARPSLRGNRHVLEGRSVHSIAVYQSLILHPNDDTAAYNRARDILAMAASWRPMPDLAILITDDTETALARAERRDGTSYTPAQRRLHHRAATMFNQLARDDTDRVRVLNRQTSDTAQAIAQILRWLGRRDGNTHTKLARSSNDAHSTGSIAQ